MFISRPPSLPRRSHPDWMSHSHCSTNTIFMSKDESEAVAVSIDHSSHTSFVPSTNPLACHDSLHGDLLAKDVRPAAERKLVRMLDTRLLLTVILIYIMNYIDRSAIIAARLKGIEGDLGLTGIQYSTVLAILYVSYIPAQIPSNMILNRISRPSYYIPVCVMVWGLTSGLTGVTRNYGGILCARLFIGLPEAAFYPGAVYLLSRWYTRKELGSRSAFLYAGSLISNAFGGLLAAGILSCMEGVMGISAWRWMFFIEGAVTIVIGILAIFLLPDYPHNTRWLSPEQRRLAQVRISEDTGEVDEDGASESAFSGLVMALVDPKVLLFSVMSFSQILGFSYANFFPTIAATLGFSTTTTLLLTVPPWIVATVCCCLNAWHADRKGERFFHICVPCWVMVVGFIIGATTMSVAGRYIAMFLMAGGYVGSALTMSWVSNVVSRPPAKRSAAIAIVNGSGSLSFVVGSYIWKTSWGPEYRPSMYISIAAVGVSTVLTIVIRRILVHENKIFEREELENLGEGGHKRIEEAARLEGISYAEALQRKRGFRYLL
ncbi:MFS general substrate transporter [Fomes fomentarius]|nr:MFS general substrate transporter [Fomes fomentarius]